MIWFGNLRDTLRLPAGGPPPPGDESVRMEHALVRVAQRQPQLSGEALVDALAQTGWVDRETAARLLPTFRHFDADRAFAESLRALAFRGPAYAGEFRSRIQRVMEDLTGEALLGGLGPEEAVRFRHEGREGITLAYPQVQFTVGGSALKAVEAAIEEMPDALVIVAKNFQESTRAQLSALLERTEVRGTLVTLNLLLGMRATALRYQPGAGRVMDLLGSGRPLRTQDVARLGDRD
jgi:hypothetical protein